MGKLFPICPAKMAALMSFMAAAALCVAAPTVAGDQVMRTTCKTSGSIHDFSDYSLIGNHTVDLAQYAGKVVLIVNVAGY